MNARTTLKIVALSALLGCMAALATKPAIAAIVEAPKGISPDNFEIIFNKDMTKLLPFLTSRPWGKPTNPKAGDADNDGTIVMWKGKDLDQLANPRPNLLIQALELERKNEKWVPVHAIASCWTKGGYENCLTAPVVFLSNDGLTRIDPVVGPIELYVAMVPVPSSAGLLLASLFGIAAVRRLRSV